MRSVKPIITEKSYTLSSKGIYAFEVDKDLKKGEIGALVAKQYGVEVGKVRTVMMASRTKRIGKTRQEIRLPMWKKAYVELKNGVKLDVFEQKEQSTEISEVKE